MNDGGPAFPTEENLFEPRSADPRIFGRGMTLRDYFAARALEAQIHKIEPQDLLHLGRDRVADNLASLSYAFADAMLRARALKHG